MGILLGCLAVAHPALTDDLDRINDEINDIQIDVASLGPKYLEGSKFKGAQYAAERLVDGETFYRMKDYQRASIIFMDIIENYAAHAAYIDALFLYADSLFLSGDYLGARQWYRQFLDEGHRPGAGRFREKAIARLIEVAIHIDDYEGVTQYVELLGQYPTDDARYVKGKYLYFKGDYGKAKKVLDSITRDRLLQLKALYLAGVIHTVEEDYTGAIEVFLRGRSFKTETKEEKTVVDLMNLGAGRLYFEQGDVDRASECYQKIDQHSAYFDAALYESAAVFIQAGDTTRAEQTLEVLAIVVPDSQYLPKAKMLRGNLLLRTGRYDEAERVFDELVNEFTPLMAQLDSVIKERQDTRKFFFELVERSMATLDVSNVLPPLVVKWVSEEAEVRRALSLAKDLGAAKGYVKETERLIRLLEAVVDGPSHVNAIPSLRRGARRAQRILNRLGQLRGRVSLITESKLGNEVSGLTQLKQNRYQLIGQLDALPTTEEGFQQREKEAQQIYHRMRQELSKNLIRLDRLSAMTVAIERFIDNPKYSEGVPKESIEALREELRRHNYGVLKMQQQIEDLKYDIESARYRVGVGDANDKKDAMLRKRIRQHTVQELRLIASVKNKWADRIAFTLKAIGYLESRIRAFQRELRLEARKQVQWIREQVNQEKTKIVTYTASLGGLGDEAEDVVGGVAFENFTSVRKRFHDLVLKADVGIIDVAWLRKEEHTSKITELTQGRVREIKRLDNEFQDLGSSKNEAQD